MCWALCVILKLCWLEVNGDYYLELVVLAPELSPLNMDKIPLHPSTAFNSPPRPRDYWSRAKGYDYYSGLFN